MTSRFKKYRMFVTADYLESICRNTVSVNKRTDFQSIRNEFPVSEFNVKLPKDQTRESDLLSLAKLIYRLLSEYPLAFLILLFVNRRLCSRKSCDRHAER